MTPNDYAELLPLLTAHERAELDALLAAEPMSFQAFLRASTPNWTWDWPHQQVLYTYLDRITDGTCDRLAISMPPRHAKSETVTVRYVAWRIIRNPCLRVVIGCYSQVMANQFSRKVRRLVERYTPLSRECNAVDKWETAEGEGTGGGLRVVGIGGGITGQGFDLLVIDDPVKSREEADSEAYRERLWSWYTDDLYTRQEPGAAILLIMTRWHEDDLAGRILRHEADQRAAEEEADNWECLNLPALCEDPEGDPLARRSAPTATTNASWRALPACSVPTASARSTRGDPPRQKAARLSARGGASGTPPRG
jgi:hypothetical protein